MTADEAEPPPRSPAETVRAIRSSVDRVLEAVRTAPAIDERPEPSRWSIAENAEHLRLSIRPLNWALLLPGFLFRLKPSARPSLDYPGVREKYLARLAKGARAPGAFVPARLHGGRREALAARVNDAHERFYRRFLALDAQALDLGRQPHPVLGRLTWREMGYFIAYHASHHLRAIERIRGESA